MHGLLKIYDDLDRLEKEVGFTADDIVMNPFDTRPLQNKLSSLKEKIKFINEVILPRAMDFYKRQVEIRGGVKVPEIDAHKRWHYFNKTLKPGDYIYGVKSAMCENADCGKIRTENTGVVLCENPVTKDLQYLCDYCHINLTKQMENKNV